MSTSSERISLRSSALLTPYVSVVLATYNKPEALGWTLASLERQRPPFAFEVVVVDDGSRSVAGLQQCQRYQQRGLPIRTRFLRYLGAPERNPGAARNVGYRMARGHIIVAQSDEVVHAHPDTLERLVRGLEAYSASFYIGTVYNAKLRGLELEKRLEIYTGPQLPRPFFFLGALYRHHVYAIGGNSEEFPELGFDDDWFAQCLQNCLGLRPEYSPEILGWHQDHPRGDRQGCYERMGSLYRQMVDQAAAGERHWWGTEPWPFGEASA